MAPNNDMGFNTAKLKRGFYWWVALTFAGAIGVLWYALDASYRGRLDDKDKQILWLQAKLSAKERELQAWQYEVAPGLKKIAPIVEETAQKLDSITQNTGYEKGN